jgi:hypothetical protein
MPRDSADDPWKANTSLIAISSQDPRQEAGPAWSKSVPLLTVSCPHEGVETVTAIAHRDYVSRYKGW